MVCDFRGTARAALSVGHRLAIAAAKLAGYHGMTAIGEFAQALTQEQLRPCGATAIVWGASPPRPRRSTRFSPRTPTCSTARCALGPPSERRQERGIDDVRGAAGKTTGKTSSSPRCCTPGTSGPGAEQLVRTLTSGTANRPRTSALVGPQHGIGGDWPRPSCVRWSIGSTARRPRGVSLDATTRSAPPSIRDR